MSKSHEHHRLLANLRCLIHNRTQRPLDILSHRLNHRELRTQASCQLTWQATAGRVLTPQIIDPTSVVVRPSTLIVLMPNHNGAFQFQLWNSPPTVRTPSDRAHEHWCVSALSVSDSTRSKRDAKPAQGASEEEAVQAEAAAVSLTVVHEDALVQAVRIVVVRREDLEARGPTVHQPVPVPATHTHNLDPGPSANVDVHHESE